MDDLGFEHTAEEHASTVPESHDAYSYFTKTLSQLSILVGGLLVLLIRAGS